MKKKPSKKIVILIIAIILIIVGVFTFFILNNIEKNKNTKIIATKVLITEYGQEQQIKYTIKIKDYDMQSAVKEITFKTEQEAKLEYDRYEIINKYEKREIGLELKKEKLILTMPEEQFLIDIEYDTENDTAIISQVGKDKTIINQEELKKCLINQGYEVK